MKRLSEVMNQDLQLLIYLILMWIRIPYPGSALEHKWIQIQVTDVAVRFTDFLTEDKFEIYFLFLFYAKT